MFYILQQVLPYFYFFKPVPNTKDKAVIELNPAILMETFKKLLHVKSIKSSTQNVY